jgi:hypothetical protein
MINNSTQKWVAGATVKVGFLTLRVISAVAIKDGLPDIYTLTSLDGTKAYEFIPHHGLTRIN